MKKQEIRHDPVREYIVKMISNIGDNKSTKINKKSFIDRIKKLYETNLIQQTDSIIVILNDGDIGRIRDITKGVAEIWIKTQN